LSYVPRVTRRRGAVLGSALSVVLALAACTSHSAGKAPGSSAPSVPPLPAAIKAIMDKPAYANAQWSLLAVDLDTGKTLASLNPDKLIFTGSTRKLFSVGLALKTLGADHTTTTGVYRSGTVDASGVLHGDLDFVGAGDLTLGGRRTVDNKIQFTDFDHNDANNLGTAMLTPQDPLAGLQDLAAQVKAAGIRSIDGDVVIDDRLFQAYRVPNQQLLITPTMLNEDKIDVTVTPTTPGQPARIDYRPHTPGFAVTGTVMTTPPGTESTVTLAPGPIPDGTELEGVVNCVGQPSCTGQVSGTIAADYKASLSGEPQFVGVFRADNPENFARSAFVAALQAAGVTVSAPAVAANPTTRLPASTDYPAANRVAAYTSPPFAQEAQLILKVSLNLGANLDLTKYGLTQGKTTVEGALAAERSALTAMGIPGDSFAFPTNGSGSPDSQATPRAFMDLLTAMSKTPVFDAYRTALPLLGVDGSLYQTGRDLAAKGHVHGKTGTTVEGGKLIAQNLAGYIDAKNGHRIAYAVILNNFGPLKSLDDVEHVMTDEAGITNVLYESD
jgi:D-alanyl-D-alanine carboxypeptidase/D-alanyl-D-alanine-endopeptidase (penicillin-binding protein 4)